MTLQAKAVSNKRNHNGHNCNTRGKICYPRKAQHYFIYQLQMTKCVETNNVIYNIGSAFLNFETLIETNSRKVFQLKVLADHTFHAMTS